MDHNIPEKANRVLNIIILGLLLILIRVWYLAVIQHDEQLEKARKPRRRIVVEKVERATIRDRFNIPLALNKIQYNAAICYADIRQIPATKWEINEEGKRVRVQLRAKYIKNLSEQLAKELGMDAQKIEDTIHGKASLFPHTPFILKEDLCEEEYYRLKMMQRDWVGIHTEKGSKRYYPLGKVGSDVIGYMGAISSKEYYTIAQELKILQGYLKEREMGELAILPKGYQNPLEVREKLKALQEKAYTINDLVGKAGVESTLDAELRGFAGKKIYEVDTKGHFLRELPGGQKGVAGHRLLLSISSELQEFAEQLLANNEMVREAHHPNGDVNLSAPWIKGGAIVALDPRNADVLALASYPRIDPNDFIPSRTFDVKADKQACIAKWLENETHIGQIWDGKKPLERERFDEKTQKFISDTLELTLDRYFEIILPPQSEILRAMQKIGTVGEALTLQYEMEKLLELSGQTDFPTLINALYAEEPHRPSKIPVLIDEKNMAQQKLIQNAGKVHPSKVKIDAILNPVKHNDDKLLIIDLCRMLVDKERVSSDLMRRISPLPLSFFRELNQSATIVDSFLLSHARSWFHQKDFQKWREKNFKQYLQTKRREEKTKKQYAKPYTQYLDQIEKQMFKAFWKENRLLFMHSFIQTNAESIPSESLLVSYIDSILQLRKEPSSIQIHAEKIKNATASFSREEQLHFLQPLNAFEDLQRPLYGKYRNLRNTKGIQMQKHLAAAFYPLSGYGYGRSLAFRQSTPQGSVFKIVVAYQSLLERYQKLKSQHRHLENLNPLTLIDDLKWHPKSGSVDQIVGYSLNGQTITRLYKGGLLPRSHPNIGKIDIVGAIEQSSNIYFSILAGDCLENPLNLIQASKEFGFGEKTGIELPGEIAGTLPDDLLYNQTGLYSFAIGQHSLVVTPLQTAVMLAAIANQGKVLKPKVVQVIAGQEPLREYRDPFLHSPHQKALDFQENLAAIGIHFPLFTAIQSEGKNPYIWYNATEIRKNIHLPDVIRNPIIQGMHQVIVGQKGTARPNIIRALAQNVPWMRDYLDLRSHFIGKTGTAEILYKQTIDSETVAKIQNHIWFAGIAFKPEEPQVWEDPEIVVVIYLRFSEAGGKEAAPLAAQIIKKWREICKRHGRAAHVLLEEDY